MSEASEILLTELKAIKQLLSAPAKQWLNVNESAEYLGIGKSKMYELLSSREIPYSTIGDKKMVKVENLEKYMKFQEVVSTNKEFYKIKKS